MITETIIKVLRNDSTLQSLLGGTTANNTPVFTSFNFEDTVNKQINVELEYGETVPFEQEAKTHDGELRVYVLVKDTLSEPINTLNNITKRILELVDLKGTTLDSPDTIYWIQKLDSDFTHYDTIKFYEAALTFRFVITEA